MNFIQVPNHKLQGQRQASCENFVESFCKDNGISSPKSLLNVIAAALIQRWFTRVIPLSVIYSVSYLS